MVGTILSVVAAIAKGEGRIIEGRAKNLTDSSQTNRRQKRATSGGIQFEYFFKFILTNIFVGVRESGSTELPFCIKEQTGSMSRENSSQQGANPAPQSWTKQFLVNSCYFAIGVKKNKPC